MPITRTQAMLRLVALWNCRCIDDPAYALRVKLADVLLPDVADAVIAGDLFAEFDLEERVGNLTQIDRERQRNQDLIRAWLAPCCGRAQ